MFKPDYGLKLLRAGHPRSTDLFFYDFHLFSLTILSPALYSTTVDKVSDGELHALSLDFDHSQFQRIFAQAAPWVTARLMAQLSSDPLSPRSIDLAQPVIFGVRARLGVLQAVENEQFMPLVAQEIL